MKRVVSNIFWGPFLRGVLPIRVSLYTTSFLCILSALGKRGREIFLTLFPIGSYSHSFGRKISKGCRHSDSIEVCKNETSMLSHPFLKSFTLLLHGGILAIGGSYWQNLFEPKAPGHSSPVTVSGDRSARISPSRPRKWAGSLPAGAFRRVEHPSPDLRPGLGTPTPDFPLGAN